MSVKNFYFCVDNFGLLTIMVDVKSLESNRMCFQKTMAGVGLSVTTAALSLMSVTIPRPLYKGGDSK